MADEVLSRDENRITVLAGITDDANNYIKMLRVDPTTKRLLISATVSGLSLTVGTTVIASGTTTRILYNNAGVLGEYTISGSGTIVAMATAPTFGTSITGSYLTASEILITDTNKKIVSAPVATYPSLTELSYVKGVTSALQTQIGNKAPTANPTFTGTVILPKTLEIQDTSADHQYVLAVSELTADRTITLPLLTGTDTFVFEAHTQTLTNKTFGAYKLDGTPDTDATANGPQTNTFASGYSSAVGDLVFFGSSGKWLEVDSDAVATCNGLLGIALEAKTDTQAMLVALPGSFIRLDSWNWTVGATLYAGETLGAMQEAIPTGADAIIKVVGFAVSADVVYFNPSPDQQSAIA
jgi:hypothetical protein